MPLHDWTDRPGWEGMHLFWMTEIARDLRGKLPPGYRAVIGSSPLVAIGATPVKPDVAVAQSGRQPPTAPARTAIRAPDFEVAVATLDEDTSVQVERDGRLVAVVELVSPRNKDRPAAREQYAARYLGYLRGGVHLLLVDVHRRPHGFAFPQRIAEGLGETLPVSPAPSAATLRVGATAASGGRMLAVWQHALAVGAPLSGMPLPLTLDDAVMVELEATYARAAADSYLD